MTSTFKPQASRCSFERRKPVIEQWFIEKLNPLKGEKLIIVADPQRMIRAGAAAVDSWAKDNGFTVLFCSGNLALREMYENLREDASAKIILVDRTRQNARRPLFYPDLEARTKPKARLTITLRDFLVEKTGDERWPLLVNTDRNLSGLIVERLDKAFEAYRQLRDVDEHRFQDSDLYKIVVTAKLTESGKLVTPTLPDAYREQKVTLPSSPRVGEVIGLAVIGDDRGCKLSQVRR